MQIDWHSQKRFRSIQKNYKFCGFQCASVAINILFHKTQ